MDMKKTTEVVVTGAMLAISLTAPMNAYAAGASIASTPTAQTVNVSASAAGGYVVEAFKLNLSAHTSLAYEGDTTAVGVKAANAKGMHTFGGSTNGGAVKACETSSVATPSVSSASISAGC